MSIKPVPTLTDVPPFPALTERALGTYNSSAYSFGHHMSGTFNDELLAVALNVLHNAQQGVLAALGAAASDAQAATRVTAAELALAGSLDARDAALAYAQAAGGAAGIPQPVPHRVFVSDADGAPAWGEPTALLAADTIADKPSAGAPAYLEQHLSGLFGRGMLTAEPVNVVTEQAITEHADAGQSVIRVASSGAFVPGGTLVIQHPSGDYWPHFVLAVSGDGVSITPPLREAVAVGSRVERLWFNRAHPGKFYIRYLAQRVARATELESAPPARRVAYIDCSQHSDLAAVGGAALSFFESSNVGNSGTLATPVRFTSGTSAYVDLAGAGAGIATVARAVNGFARAVVAVVMFSDAAAPINVEARDGDGRLLASTLVMGHGHLQIARLAVDLRNARAVTVRLLATAAGGTLVLNHVDIYAAPELAGSVIANKTGTIVCLGDSWVAGDLVTTPEREPITVQLSRELPNATVINAGVGGNDVYNLLARFDVDVAPHKPAYVVVNTGTNDIYNPSSVEFDPGATNNYNDVYKRLLGRIAQIGARAILIGVPALAQSDADTSLPEWQLNDRAMLMMLRWYQQSAVYAVDEGMVTRPAGATIDAGATPSVKGLSVVDLNYAAPQNITNFLGGVKAQEVLVINRGAANVTLVHGFFLLTGSVNAVLTPNSTLTLLRSDPPMSDGWVEIARSLK